MIGTKTGNDVTVTDVVPLFHDHIFTDMLEVALEMVDVVLEQEGNNKSILGIYDAPVRVKLSSSPSLSPIAESVANQIKIVKGLHDAIGLSVSMLEIEHNEEKEEDLEDTPTTKLEGFAVGGLGAALKKIEMTQEGDQDEIVSKVVTARNYSRIVDFDDHFNDISLDWRNNDFAL